MRERCQQLINFLSEVISLVLVITFLSVWEMAFPVTRGRGEGGGGENCLQVAATAKHQPFSRDLHTHFQRLTSSSRTAASEVTCGGRGGAAVSSTAQVCPLKWVWLQVAPPTRLEQCLTVSLSCPLSTGAYMAVPTSSMLQRGHTNSLGC